MIGFDRPRTGTPAVAVLAVMMAAGWLTPAAARAQPRALRIEGVGSPVRVEAVTRGGHAGYAADALRGLGAVVETQARGVRVVLFGDTLRFETLSPFFHARGGARQLVAPVFREGDVVYLPHQFFAEWLPGEYADRLRFADGTLALTDAGRAAVAGAGDAAGRAAARSAAASGAAARSGAATDDPPTGNGAATNNPAARSGAAVAAPAPAGDGPRVVVIDAGHGGRDPGRLGPYGIREEQLALAVSRRLAAILEARGGYEVHMTRTTDTLIDLADRPELANRWKAGRPAAVFISIHANAVSSRSPRGFETFILSEARTDDERRVAEMENAAVQYEERAPDAPAREDVGVILNTLRNDFYLRASNDLAEIIQRRIDRIHPGPNRGVKQAGFVVLIGAFMPSVLFEMGFVSNPAEARLLADPGFQNRICVALADAIGEFFDEHEYLWAAGTGT